KGGNFLDSLAKIQNVVMDKTGTMTEGVFKVQDIEIEQNFNEKDILEKLNLVESKSTHPIAKAIHDYVGEINHSQNISNIEEIAGFGLKANFDGKEFLAGNFKLLEKFNINFDKSLKNIPESVVTMAFDNQFVGYITIADEIKKEAKSAVDALKKLGIKVTMLSGDKTAVVEKVAKTLGIQNYFGSLLPEDKVAELDKIKAKNETVAFVGDGVNDAPVVALSDVGIAMGGLGSDATIETADVVIQDDNPAKIAMAIKIGKATKKIVWQNITLAFGVKAVVLILGAGGLATMWEAVFADVGVALLAILNAVRIQKMTF
ncbi:MAG: HAD-IC family P-type ATPase, partial [Chryseobacterium sp.]|nr:HAD-IC family P-type ATPase [Chryseobacterium sp.]